jgi:hypothetical protein
MTGRRIVTRSQNLPVQLLCIAALAACASHDPVERQPDADIAAVAKALGCSDDEVAVCVDVNCEPREYRCANKADVKALLGVRDYARH